MPRGTSSSEQRILDHRSITLVDPMDAMARLQLARGLTLAGDTVKAKGVYEELLKLWKDADPKLALVAAARSEYAIGKFGNGTTP
jgi:hypothetical protein